MQSDIDIAKKASMLNIEKIAPGVGINEEYLELYGKYKAKFSLDIFKR